MKSYKNRSHLYRYWRGEGIEPAAYVVGTNEEGRFYAIFPVKTEEEVVEVPNVEVPNVEVPTEEPTEEPTTPRRKKAYVHSSSIESPVAYVHATADRLFKRNNNVTRKEIIEACIAGGVATGTARKQYNDWRVKNGR